MNIIFTLIAAGTLIAAVAAMTLRNLIYCALSATAALGGLALLYFQLDAQFLGLAQILVYIGAVAILIVFAILLTRAADLPEPARFDVPALAGIGVALVVLATLVGALGSSPALRKNGSTIVRGDTAKSPVSLAVIKTPAPTATIAAIGNQMLSRYLVPFETIGLLLTAAMIGAVIIAMPSHRAKK